MAVITKRKNVSKSKSNSKTRKQFNSIRKNGMKTRKLRGGVLKNKTLRPAHLQVHSIRRKDGKNRQTQDKFMINPVKLAAGPQIKWYKDPKSIVTGEISKPFDAGVPVVTDKTQVELKGQNPVDLKRQNGTKIQPYNNVMNRLQINIKATADNINNLNKRLTQSEKELGNLPKTFFKTKQQKELKQTISSIMKNSSTLRDLKQRLERQFKVQEQGGN